MIFRSPAVAVIFRSFFVNKPLLNLPLLPLLGSLQHHTLQNHLAKMDPAEPDPIRAALARQGFRLGQHEEMFRGVMEAVQNLSTQVRDLSTQLSRLDPGVPSPTVSTAPPPPPAQPSPHLVPRKEPHVPAPEPYAGEIGGAGGFILRCSLVFDQQPLSYPSDRAKIAYTINLLRGRAAQWATALWEQGSSILSSFDNFSHELCRIFDHPRQGQESAKRLFSLVQGSRSVADFSIDFRIAASESGWGELELRGVFLKNLSSELKDELASRDEPDSLESLISLAIRIDNRLRERRREKVQASFPSVREAASPVPPPALPVPSLQSPATSTSSTSSQIEPMQLGRARLSPSERQRRFNQRLCIYCGQAGHFLANCPQKPKGQAHP